MTGARVPLLLALLWFLCCTGEDDVERVDYVPGELIVRFVPGTTQSEVEALAGDLGVGVRDIRFDLDSPSDVWMAVFVVPEGQEVEWIPIVEESPAVKYAALNAVGYIGPNGGCQSG